MVNIECKFKEYVIDQILFATWLKLRLNAEIMKCYLNALVPAIPPTFTGGYVLLIAALPTSLIITFPILDTSLVNSRTKSWICFARSNRSKVDWIGNDIKIWNSLFQSRLLSFATARGGFLKSRSKPFNNYKWFNITYWASSGSKSPYELWLASSSVM